jgi:hypothetical protein
VFHNSKIIHSYDQIVNVEKEKENPHVIHEIQVGEHVDFTCGFG